MTNLLNTFTSFFNMEGNAEEKIQRISNNMYKLGQVSRKARLDIEDVREGFIGVGRGGLKPIDEAAYQRIDDVFARLNALSEASRLTSSNLQQLSDQLQVAALSASPFMASRVDEASRSLLSVAATLRIAEDRARKTATSFNFMGDVSEGTQNAMRRISAASQGAMLGMSLLQGNVVGLAFSLIFLQFSGALKVSLALSALTIIAGLAFKELKRVFELRKEARGLGNALQITTGNEQAFSLVQNRSKDIAEKLGLAQRDEEKVVRALSRAQVELREEGYLTNDVLTVFTSSFLRATAAGNDFEQSMQVAKQRSIEFADEGRVQLGRTFLSLEDFIRRGEEAVTVLTDPFEGWTGLPIQLIETWHPLATLDDIYNRAEIGAGGFAEALRLTESAANDSGTAIGALQTKMTELIEFYRLQTMSPEEQRRYHRDKYNKETLETVIDEAVGAMYTPGALTVEQEINNAVARANRLAFNRSRADEIREFGETDAERVTRELQESLRDIGPSGGRGLGAAGDIQIYVDVYGNNIRDRDDIDRIGGILTRDMMDAINRSRGGTLNIVP
jgi:hypothetical protein